MISKKELIVAPVESTDSRCAVNDCHALNGWKSSDTERLLSWHHGMSVDDQHVIILDHAMENGADNGGIFCLSLRQELEDSGLINNLKPAKTAGERRAESMLRLLSEYQDVSSPSSLPHDQQERNNNETTPIIRGDKSLFVAREYRHGKNQRHFEERHPFLHKLISTTSKTIEEAVDVFNRSDDRSMYYRLDLSNTSVQVAVYPGDGKSGYVRHCDRGEDGCLQKSAKVLSSHPSIIGSDSQRLLTAIYYLADDDWNSEMDGGALRIYHQSTRRREESDTEDSFSDISPRQDRLLIFRSDAVEHEVLPSLRRPRTAITMWFYGSQYQKTPMSTVPTSIESQRPPPLPIQELSIQSKNIPSIFVSIASYRDSEIRPTLDALFASAQNSQRIFCGLVLQLQDETPYDDTIWRQVASFTLPTQLRCIRLNAKDAMGPCYARGLAQTLYRGEDFFLQIDSHMRFRRNWDEYLILKSQEIIDRTGNPMVMLTTYPIGYTLPDNIPDREVRGTYLVPWKFDNQGRLRQKARLLSTTGDNRERFYRHYLFAGGFNFAPAQVLKDVPYDTMGLPHLFFGEELSMAVRLFTHGYDLYAPWETVCYHLWSRAHRPSATSKRNDPHDLLLLQQQKQRALSEDRVMLQLLGDPSMIRTPFGLGTLRTAKEFADRLRVDFCLRKCLEGFENGELSSDCFASSEISSMDDSTFPHDSVEAKVSSLDYKSKSLISFFLNGIIK